MYFTIHTLTYNGIGSLNSKKDGSPKSLIIAGVKRLYVSGAKVRLSFRLALQRMGHICSLQTREMPAYLAEFAKRKNEKNLDKALEFCIDLMHSYLKHSKADAKFQVGKFSQAEVDMLTNIAKQRGSGKEIDIKGLDLNEKMESFLQNNEYNIDQKLFGSFAPLRIDGCWKHQNSIGVTAANDEKDFFITMDDLIRTNKVKGSGAGHMDGESKYVSSSLCYGYSKLNVDELLTYLGGDKKQANKVLNDLLKVVVWNAPKSESVNCPNQGLVTYVMIERIEDDIPVSLEIAFENPVNTTPEAVSRLRSFKKSLDKTYGRGESKGTPFIEFGLDHNNEIKGLSSLEDAKKFFKI